MMKPIFITAITPFSFVKFEIPISTLISIPFSKTIFMNTSLGLITSLSPAYPIVKSKKEGIYTFKNNVLVKRESLSLTAKVGFDYHTKKTGIFSLGYSVRVPLQPSFNWYTTYNIYKETNNIGISKFIKGSYTSIILIYFLPLIRQKGKQIRKGLIE